MRNNKKKSKKTERKESYFKKRMEFLNKYHEFNYWLKSIGFNSTDYTDKSVYNCHYSHYNKYIDALCSVESYHHDILDVSIYFLRDRNEHKFMFVGEMGSCSEVYSLQKTKYFILELVRKHRDEQLSKLNSLINI